MPIIQQMIFFQVAKWIFETSTSIFAFKKTWMPFLPVVLLFLPRGIDFLHEGFGILGSQELQEEGETEAQLSRQMATLALVARGFGGEELFWDQRLELPLKKTRVMGEGFWICNKGGQ